jgi:hypothetical protein
MRLSQKVDAQIGDMHQQSDRVPMGDQKKKKLKLK